MEPLLYPLLSPTLSSINFFGFLVEGGSSKTYLESTSKPSSLAICEHHACQIEKQLNK